MEHGTVGKNIGRKSSFYLDPLHESLFIEIIGKTNRHTKIISMEDVISWLVIH